MVAPKVFKTNQSFSKFSLTGNKFKQEFHLRQPCFGETKNERMEKSRLKTMEKNKAVIHKKDIDKSCCQHDKTYWH